MTNVGSLDIYALNICTLVDMKINGDKSYHLQ